MENRFKQSADLCKRAEAVLLEETLDNIPTLSSEEIQKTLHNLRVHQIELEMQNEDLLQVQMELDTARMRYLNLYDNAPSGYLTISDTGQIVEANLTAASILGCARGDLANKPLTQFIFKEDQDIYYLYRKQHADVKENNVCDLRMVKNGEIMFWVRLAITALQQSGDGVECYVVMSDITDLKRAEEAMKIAHDNLEQRVSERTADLENKNAMLSMMLDYARKAETDIQERVVASLRSNIINIAMLLKKEQLPKGARDLVELIETTAYNLAHPFIKKLESQMLRLTEREIHLATFIRQGKSTKELMELFNLSAKTVEAHRNNIRKKLGLCHKKINLRTFLNSNFFE